MRLAIFTGLTALLTTITALDFPTTITYSLISPLNKTYNTPLTTLPLIFALQNADAAFQFGYTLTWDVTLGSEGQILRMGGFPSPPEAAANNGVWYDYSNITYYRPSEPFAPGHYNVSTRYIMGSCTDTPSTVNIGVTVLEASVEFEVVDDGSGEDVAEVYLTAQCPILQDSVTVERLTGPVVSTRSCPVIAEGSGGEVVDTCEAKMSEELVECVLRDLTGAYNVSTCEGAPPRQGNDSGGNASSTVTTGTGEAQSTPTSQGSGTAGDTSGTSGGATPSQSSAGSNSGTRQYVPSFGAAAFALLAAVASLY